MLGKHFCIGYIGQLFSLMPVKTDLVQISRNFNISINLPLIIKVCSKIHYFELLRLVSKLGFNKQSYLPMYLLLCNKRYKLVINRASHWDF